MRAQSVALSPGLYAQMGHDPEAIVEAGKAALRARFEPMRRRAEAVSY